MHQTSIGTKKKKQTIPTTTQKWTHSSWKFCFFCFFWCLCRFGASSGFFVFVFFGACAGLVILTSQNIDRHQKTQKTKPLDAPNIDRHQKKQKTKKIQQLLRSGPIVPGNFSFFVFFGACAGLVHLVVWFFWCLCRFGDSDFTKH